MAALYCDAIKKVKFFLISLSCFLISLNVIMRDLLKEIFEKCFEKNYNAALYTEIILFKLIFRHSITFK